MIIGLADFDAERHWHSENAAKRSDVTVGQYAIDAPAVTPANESDVCIEPYKLHHTAKLKRGRHQRYWIECCMQWMCCLVSYLIYRNSKRHPGGHTTLLNLMVDSRTEQAHCNPNYGEQVLFTQCGDKDEQCGYIKGEKTRLKPRSIDDETFSENAAMV